MLKGSGQLEGFISIHASREGGDDGVVMTHRKALISIHASREGGDEAGRGLYGIPQPISIHASREGGDARPARATRPPAGKISIHASREGGDQEGPHQCCNPSISIHASREGGDDSTASVILDHIHISIHASREGGDSSVEKVKSKCRNFNPRLP